MAWTRSFAATLAYYQASFLPSGARLTMPKLQLAQKTEIAACDKLDGLTDGLIADPARCTWKAAALLCRPGSDPAACLTDEEAAAIDRIRAPLHTPGGERIYPGLFAGSEAQWRNALGFNLVTSNFYRHMVMNDANWTPDARTDLVDVLRRSEAAGSAGPLINSTNPDLSAFRARGGKLIQYHGWSDPSFGPGYAPLYYSEVVDLQAGGDKLASTQDFYRLFMAPGMAHCYGGEGPIHFGALDHMPSPLLDADHDILEALDRWVENGKAPRRIIATQYSKDDAPERQMPLCPWPQVALFTGGDPKRAESFTCTPGKSGTTAG